VHFAFAQKTVSGTVSDESGALPGVSVLIKGTTTGTETDFDGKYSLQANAGDILQFSYIGMETTSKTVGAASTYNVVMAVDAANVLDEVVVTALGIKREKKSLGYSTQKVKGDAVSTVKDANFMNSLSGKIAGVDLKNSGTMGGSTNVVIRGYSSMYGNNQALFVIDGVPISNENTTDRDARTGRGGYDYGNASQDINPDDIASVNILKGGAATALYGSRAANGVVIITTKKGKSRKKGLGVTVNSSMTFNNYNPDTFAVYQDQYGAGYYDGWHPGGFYLEDQDGDGIDEKYVLSDWDGSYGIVKFDENLMVHQWDSFYPELTETYGKASPWLAGKSGPSSIFETGTTMFNSFAIDGNNEKGSFRLSYTKLDQKGILANSEIGRDNVSLGATYKLSDKLTATGKATFVKSTGLGRYGTGYDSANPMQGMKQWWQTNVDMAAQKKAYFDTKKNITWNTSYINHDLHPIYHDNFYWSRYENYQNDSRDRFFGNAALTYEITDWLSVFGRITTDTYSSTQEERINNHSTDVSRYEVFTNNFTENNYDLMLQFDKNLTEKINLKGVLGSNIMRQEYSSMRSSTNGGINIDRLFSLKNSKNSINAPAQYNYLMGVNGFYANASIGYDNLVFLEGSFRQDTASTLPADDNTYSYYGVSGSFLFSKLINTDLIQLGKFRVGYAKTGNAANPLSIFNTYGLSTPVGGQASASLPSTNNNSKLQNEGSTEKEVGLEMVFIKRRLGFDLSLYDKISSDLITPISTTPQIGYTNQWLNAGEIQNKGVELSLWGSPVKTNNFEWKIDLNWGKNNNEVLSLPEGLKNLQLASVQGGISINATVGQPYGTIQGFDYVYEGGQKVIKSNGAYLKSDTSDIVLGTFQPEWKGGLNNKFTFKNISFSFLIDMQKGGSIFSLDTWYGMGTGLYPETAGLNELGKDVRSPTADGGGILLDGVMEDPDNPGTYIPNTTRAKFDYFANAYGWAKAPNAHHVYDAGFIKLREVTLSYVVPQNLLKNNFIEGITLSVIGKNLWIIDKSLPYGDPEAGLSSGNIQGYQSGSYPTTKDYGFNVKLQF